jgi:hypothetical protein
MKLFKYATPLAVILWVLAHVLVVVSLIIGLAIFESNLVAALGISAAFMMVWPLVRQLAPVAYSVVISGTWPKLPSR